MLLLSFSGVVKGETGRIWLFLAPFMAAGAAPALLPRERGDWRLVALTCALTAVQVLVMAAAQQPIARPSDPLRACRRPPSPAPAPSAVRRRRSRDGSPGRCPDSVSPLSRWWSARLRARLDCARRGVYPDTIHIRRGPVLHPPAAGGAYRTRAGLLAGDGLQQLRMARRGKETRRVRRASLVAVVVGALALLGGVGASARHQSLTGPVSASRPTPTASMSSSSPRMTGASPGPGCSSAPGRSTRPMSTTPGSPICSSTCCSMPPTRRTASAWARRSRRWGAT